MATVYEYRTGCSIRGIKVETVAAVVEGIMQARGGQMTPADLVAASRPKKAPLHSAFTWDDTIAAEKHRESEARRIIHSYEVVRTDERGIETREIANVSAARPYDPNGPKYMPASDAMQSPEIRDQIINLAQSILAGWQHRFGHLTELAAAAELVRQAQEAAAKPAPAPRRRHDRRRQPAVATL